MKSHLENKLDTRIKHFSTYKLLIIVEEEVKMFFQLIDKRYEKKSSLEILLSKLPY